MAPYCEPPGAEQVSLEHGCVEQIASPPNGSDDDRPAPVVRIDPVVAGVFLVGRTGDVADGVDSGVAAGDPQTGVVAGVEVIEVAGDRPVEEAFVGLEMIEDWEPLWVSLEQPVGLGLAPIPSSWVSQR